MIEILFWIGLIVTLWGVGGYAPFAWLWARLVPLTSPAPDLPDGQLPTITVVIAAWNEGVVLTEKLQNTRAMDYPESLVRILFVTDGSSDGSPELLAHEPDVTVLHRPERMGKAAAMNRAMRHVETEIVVFTDANAMLNHNALRRIAARYQDSRVGAVAGEKRVLAQASGSVSGAGEGLYWRYESWLKRLDSDLWSPGRLASCFPFEQTCGNRFPRIRCWTISWFPFGPPPVDTALRTHPMPGRPSRLRPT